MSYGESLNWVKYRRYQPVQRHPAFSPDQIMTIFNTQRNEIEIAEGELVQFFTTIVTTPEGAYVDSFNTDPRNYWNLDGITLKDGVYNLAFTSRFLIHRPRVVAGMVAPDLSDYDDENFVAIGLTQAHRITSPSMGLRFEKIAGFERFIAYAGFPPLAEDVQLDLTERLPPDAKATRYRYWIRVGKHMACMGLESSILAFLIFTGSPTYVFSADPNPYAIALLDTTTYSSSTLPYIYLFITKDTSPPLSFTVNLPVFHYYFYEDSSPLNISMPLYVQYTTTPLQGQSFSTTVTSHPFPAVNGATVTFEADQDSTPNGLEIQVLLPNALSWMTYDRITYTAYDKFIYSIPGPYPLARLVYTPSTASTILAAETQVVDT